MPDLRWGLATDPGRVRPENEDNALADQRVFMVADGMGGHRAGEVAAAIAVDLLRARLSAPGATLEDVVAAIAEANTDIFGAANDNPEQQGMGTTVTGLVLVEEQVPVEARAQPGDIAADDTMRIDVLDASEAVTSEAPDTGADDAGEPVAAPDDDAAVGEADDDGRVAPVSWALVNVGDSRTYLLRHDRLRRVTIDHSYVQELVATGHLTDDEARNHPRRNIVTRALGIDPSVRVDAWTLPVVRGDRFLVCSDGLVDEVRDTAIASILTTVGDPQHAAEELVAAANRSGGRDNITVIVVDVLEGDDPPDPTSELDLEPAWDGGTTASSWAVDDPEGEATEYEDLAALVGTAAATENAEDASTDPIDLVQTADATEKTASADPVETTETEPDGDDRAADGAPVLRTTTDEVPVIDGSASRPPRRRRRVAGFLGGVGVIAVILLALVIAAAWARRGYFVAFDGDDNVAIYRGRAEGFLWFDPTVDGPVALSREELDEASIDLVEREVRFDSRDAAEEFVAGRLDTTTTTTSTTTTTTTTTTSTTTTTTPSTTVAP